MEKIKKKVAEIRKQPDHIRMRYVLLAVAFSMAIIVIVWVLSVKQNLSNVGSKEINQPTQNSKGIDDMREQFDKMYDDISEQKNIINDMQDDTMNEEAQLRESEKDTDKGSIVELQENTLPIE